VYVFASEAGEGWSGWAGLQWLLLLVSAAALPSSPIGTQWSPRPSNATKTQENTNADNVPAGDEGKRYSLCALADISVWLFPLPTERSLNDLKEEK
jgi:hypothetical protein